MRERGLKYTHDIHGDKIAEVAPVRERGLKCRLSIANYRKSRVAPVRERGLKYVALQDTELIVKVAPVRERGLKLCRILKKVFVAFGRSREGAWIEINYRPSRPLRQIGRAHV